MAGEPTVSTEDLVTRCAAGEARALQLLYERTSAQLFGLLRRILIRDDLAQEALQDVYVSVWKHADRYNASKGAAFTWLVSIARYRAIDIRRKRAREISASEYVEAQPADAAAERESETGDPLGAAAHQAAVRRLEICFEELKVQERNALRLAYLSGLTHQEVAVHLGAPIGTIKSWIRRGLEGLRRCLGS